MGGLIKIPLKLRQNGIITMTQLNPWAGWVATVALILLPVSLKAETLENPTFEVNEETSSSQTQSTLSLTPEQIRQACAAQRYDLLPIPFSDVAPTDWAFEAVMNLYYCIGLTPQFESNSSINQSKGML